MDKIEMNFRPIKDDSSITGKADVYNISIMAGFNGPYATFFLKEDILSGGTTLFEKNNWYTEHISKMVPDKKD